MKTRFVLALLLLSASAQAAELFPLSRVRLAAGPFLEAQTTDLHYMLAMEPDRLLAPFLREAGLTPRQPGYGNWESTGLDGHMGGHYLSALALMVASTGDAEALRRLHYVVAELKRAQEANGDGYLGGIPGGRQAWRDVAAGKIKADNFAVNGKWVPWYNLHKVYAGLLDAWVHTGNEDARAMLVKLSDWALRLTAQLSDAQMQAMLRSEHGGMNEIFADVAQMTGDGRYLDLALRFSHQSVLQPLARGEDKLTGLHANTQIPKVIGFQRIAELTGRDDMRQAARFFWQTVRDKRTVAIGGNSVKEHIHDTQDFSSMISEVEGPETCNTYNMLKLTGMLFHAEQKSAYGDYYERALYNHILSSQRPGGGFVYFTPLRPNHYRVYSQVDKGMWCCVGSGIESHAKYGEFVYAHEKDILFVNLFIASTLDWREKGVRITQSTRFPDEGSTRITVDAPARFAMKIRYPAWVAAGAMKVRVNGKPVALAAQPGSYVSLERAWRKNDRVDVLLPMRTQLEQMPDGSNYYAVLHGPIVLAAKTRLFKDDELNFMADASRMGHIAQGPVCPLEAAPMLVSDSTDFLHRFKPVKGKPLTFTAPGLVRGASGTATEFIPFFRLHDSRYTMVWQQSTPAKFERLQAENAAREAERLALDAITIDQVAPGEQQPESDHFFKGEGSEAGVTQGRHWRHAKGWFSYELKDPQRAARVLRLTFARADAGRRFKLLVDDTPLAAVELAAGEGETLYTRDFPLPPDMARRADGSMTVKFEAAPGSRAGALYGLRLLR
ncbi:MULTISPECIES: glycoside hydrolase family 127 protein [unclassified Massilia]|uniref:glycoside hydrolase family 127 protein n=1 Tax=unclassified Massilia TaxID=2609279 RepID=UPI001784DB44|nr:MULTISPECIES: glycoside hydrolase family 127 protein [unclassified Massilia]MBD8531064.1 glycoside hydrolase family 127 protein [Massilia sp. CFBP 13647]MBD8674764.1 glycoside hydrolase family 127 protein [Massilia sp. CFBP 13721]